MARFPSSQLFVWSLLNLASLCCVSLLPNLPVMTLRYPRVTLPLRNHVSSLSMDVFFFALAARAPKAGAKPGAAGLSGNHPRPARGPAPGPQARHLQRHRAGVLRHAGVVGASVQVCVHRCRSLLWRRALPPKSARRERFCSFRRSTRLCWILLLLRLLFLSGEWVREEAGKWALGMGVGGYFAALPCAGIACRVYRYCLSYHFLGGVGVGS